ncbi:transcriptional corepressor LEUNIG-like [Lotus japonicus]|uniref:transcriptional corepressor LEUNIG-like n=1 Tax=Lotus japonicus TaxID=34305 RepID=UPI00258A8345|nr:transcriptional corepressor LEUNIG-like [Lotus japonicus]
MSRVNYEADRMLDEYIHDYFVKRQLHASASTFQTEGNVSTEPVVIDAPNGFLFEWWSVFWEIFVNRTGARRSEAAVAYLKMQQIKAREMRQQREQELPNPNQNQQTQMQLPALQQQCIGGTQFVSGCANCPIHNNPLMRKNQAICNVMPIKMYDDKLKLHPQRDAFDDATIKQKETDKVGQLLDSNHASLLKGQTTTTGQTFLCTPSILPANVQAQNQTQQLPGSRQGFDQVRSGFVQQNNSMQSASFNQFSRQPQFMLQAQQNSVLPSVCDHESRKLRRYFKIQTMGLERDGQSDFVSDSIPNIGRSAQAGSPLLLHPDSDMSLQQQVQKSIQEFQPSQHPLSSQKSQCLQRQAKIGSESMIVDGNDQASKRKIGRKRKPASSSGPANSSGTAKATASCISSPSTPSAQTPGDVMTAPTVQQNGLGSLTSAQNQLDDMEHIVDGEHLGDNVKSDLSPDAAVNRQSVDQEFSFKEIKFVKASSHKVECCHFSSDGTLFVTGGDDRKASLWCTESFNLKSTFEEHTQQITDVRFCPSMLHIATSSADKTVRVWGADNPGYSLRTFSGHASTVVSVDFHPSCNDLICSCDNTEIRYWNIKEGSCAKVFKGGATQIRFQPCMGSLLAAAKDKFISIYDVETLRCRLKLKGHNDPVRCVCWHPSGEYLASLSDDQVIIWNVAPGNGRITHELILPGKNMNTCAFHPLHNVLVIGCNETLVLWDFSQNQTMTLLRAHNSLVSSLAVSNVTGLVASVSHDNYFKIWK